MSTMPNESDTPNDLDADQKWSEALRKAGPLLALALHEHATLPVHEQARRAYTPTGPSIEELEARIRRHRIKNGLPLNDPCCSDSTDMIKEAS